MQVLDALALVGEMLSWIGLGIGVPVLLLAVMIRLVEGPWLDIEIAIIERDGSSVARWFSGGDFHERPLRHSEPASTQTGWVAGVVSAKNPGHARLGEPPHLRRILLILGIVLSGVGVLGLIGSLLPLFF